MRDKGLVWTPEAQEAFLTKPKVFVKGTRMWFPGLKRVFDLANVIAYVRHRP